MPDHLNGHHRRTLEAIFTHPLPRNIEWPDVLSLVNAIGTVVDRQNGSVVFEVGTQSETLRPPHGKDFTGDDVVKLRRMLEAAGISPDENLNR